MLCCCLLLLCGSGRLDETNAYLPARTGNRKSPVVFVAPSSFRSPGKFLHDWTNFCGLQRLQCWPHFLTRAHPLTLYIAGVFVEVVFLSTWVFVFFYIFFSLAYSESHERTDTSIKMLAWGEGWLVLGCHVNEFTIDGVICKLLSEFIWQNTAHKFHGIPWLVIGRYAAEQAMATHNFFQWATMPETKEPYHAEVIYMLPRREKRWHFIYWWNSPCLYNRGILSCHCDSLFNHDKRQGNQETESTWSVKSESGHQSSKIIATVLRRF